MTFIRKIWQIVVVVALGVVLTAIIAALILGTEIRIERHIKVVGPDEPVYYMIMRGESVAVIERELEKNPGLVRESYIMNKTLLAHAAGKGRDDVVRLLLEMGADPNGRGGQAGEYTPLMTAVGRDQETTARILIEHGADPDLKGAFGGSPRQMAEYEGDQRMLSILAEAGHEEGGGSSESTPNTPD